VRLQREEYQKLLDTKADTNGMIFKHFMAQLATDAKYILEPLNAEQMQAANAWKLDYLRRLRQENTDTQYINAYLKAWNLNETEVFPPTK
jgi:hypothetical protein